MFVIVFIKVKIEKGCKVFITGSASGIGRATAIAMAKLKTKLFLTDINEKGLEETCQMALKEGAEYCKCKPFDISKYENVKSFADEIHREFGAMDIIMNIAGIALFALVEDMTHRHWEKVINTNLWGPIHVIESFLPEMIKAKKGHVLNVSSAVGLGGAPWHAAYAAAKWGLIGLSEVLRYDLMQHNIGVTVICPGGVDTPLKYTVEFLGVRNNERVEKLKKLFSKHAKKPEEVAKMIIDAIEKNKFLVITSFDIKFIYFCKRYIPPLYNLIMVRISKILNAIKYPEKG